MKPEDAWQDHVEAWGSYLRAQRKLANLSLRQLADSAKISNPYLSQLERGMHEPSVRVVHALAHAPQCATRGSVGSSRLLERQRVGDEPARDEESTEAAIRRDSHLSDAQKQALLVVYRSYRNAADE
jgi:transcriptional regulator with XRE-family HTH domain